jgi:hypothetical protein
MKHSLIHSPTSLAASRRGISLLEVLIAMFVLLFGLMGVAAIFPVGNHYAGKGEQYDRSSALTASAIAELKARGMLAPQRWIYPDTSTVIDANGWFAGAPTNPANLAGMGQAFVIDPLGAAETATNDAAGNFFPYGANAAGVPWTLDPAGGGRWPIRRVTFGSYLGGPKMSTRVAETVMQLRDDLSTQLPTENDHPGRQVFQVDNNGTENNPTDDLLLARGYAGSYTWLATVVPTSANGDPFVPDALQAMQPSDPRHGSFLYDVSVAVFLRREITPGARTERMLAAELGPGGDLVLYDPQNDAATVDFATEDVRPGRWIALVGPHPSTGKLLLYWYKLLSLDDETADGANARSPLRLLSNTNTIVTGRSAMVDGPEWPTTSSQPVAQNLRAILLPGVIGVTTQTLKLNEE